jgi:hypothetical protein
MQSFSRILIAAGVLLLMVSSRLQADFTPPENGKLTEKQITSFIAIQKQQIDTLKAASNAGAGASGAAGIAIYARASEKIDAAVAQNGMTKDEYNWVSEQFTKLWPIAAYQKQWEESAKPDLEKQIKAKQDESAENQAKLQAYTSAQKNGSRVMTKEQRDAAVASATSDRDTIASEVKTDQDALKPISDEVAQHEKDAADAEALAKNPPADVTADQKDGYIDQRKNDAQAAHDAAKDARDRLTEAHKNLDDAQARLLAAQRKLDHPDQPVTDDEKAQVKSENEQGITDAKSAISNDDQAIATLKQTLAAGPMSLTGNGQDKPDPDNLALVQKHLKEYLDAIGAGAALQPK